MPAAKPSSCIPSFAPRWEYTKYSFMGRHTCFSFYYLSSVKSKTGQWFHADTVWGLENYNCNFCFQAFQTLVKEGRYCRQSQHPQVHSWHLLEMVSTLFVGQVLLEDSLRKKMVTIPLKVLWFLLWKWTIVQKRLQVSSAQFFIQNLALKWDLVS